MFKIADAHCDYLAYHVVEHGDNRLYDHIDIERLKQGGVALQNFAVWVPPEAKEKRMLGQWQIAWFHRFIAQSGGEVRLCADEGSLKAGNGVCAVLSIESGESINCQNEYIPYVYQNGVRIFSLTWNGENEYGSGCMAGGGLKPKGADAIGLLNELNIALDVSHINETGFWEALDLYEHAPCATHSCADALLHNPRNLKKAQIEAIIAADGFIGINFYTEFLKGRYAGIGDILDHIDYILGCGGEEAVGFGSDFCGIQYTPEGLDSAADFQRVPEAMLRRGYPDALTEKICYGNFARYILKFLKQ